MVIFLSSFVIFLALTGIAYFQIRQSLQKRIELLGGRLGRLEQDHEDLLREKEKLEGEKGALVADLERANKLVKQRGWLIRKLHPHQRRMDPLELLMEQGLLDRADLDAAHSYLSDGPPGKTVEDVLVMRGAVDIRHIREAEYMAECFNSLSQENYQ